MSLEFNDNQIKTYVYLTGDKNKPDSQLLCWSQRSPVDCDYTEVVFVHKDSDEPMQMIGNQTYLVHNVPIHDEQGLLAGFTDTDECYAVYLTSHVYDKSTDKIYHSDPIVIAAQKEDLQNNDKTIFRFDCAFYVNHNSKISYSLDGKSLDFDKDSESDYVYALHCEFAVFICNDLRVEDSWIFFNDEYVIYDTPNSDSFTKLLTLDGMNDVLRGSPMVFLKIAEGEVDAHSGEFDVDGCTDSFAGIL